MPGQIVHVEFKSSDYDRTARFYSDLFGWQMQRMPEMGYMTFQAAGGPGGGFVKPETSQAPGCLAYLEVDDIEVKLAEIERAGGRVILGRMPVAEMGALAIFADPDGNTVGLWTTARREDAVPTAVTSGSTTVKMGSASGQAARAKKAVGKAARAAGKTAKKAAASVKKAARKLKKELKRGR